MVAMISLNTLFVLFVCEAHATFTLKVYAQGFQLNLQSVCSNAIKLAKSLQVLRLQVTLMCASNLYFKRIIRLEGLDDLCERPIMVLRIRHLPELMKRIVEVPLGAVNMRTGDQSCVIATLLYSHIYAYLL